MTPLQMTTPNDTTIMIVRRFDAPLASVWRAHTEPALVKRWLTGPAGHTMPECEIDLRVGGAYRYLWVWPDGQMTATGVFREVAPQERLLLTEVFDIFPDNKTLVEQVFAEKDGQTTVTMTIHYDSQATRDAVLQSPMDEGLEASYRNLDALVAETV